MIQNFVYFSLILISFSSCKAGKMTLPDGPLILKYHQPVILDSLTHTRATFTAVQDSRCPENTNCIWAGSVTVDLIFSLKNHKNKKPLKLCLGCRQGTNGALPAESDLDLDGKKYRIILQSVNPYPNAEKTKKNKDYSIAIKIDKI